MVSLVYALSGAVSVFVLLYLLVALLKPEMFQ